MERYQILNYFLIPTDSFLDFVIKTAKFLDIYNPIHDKAFNLIKISLRKMFRTFNNLKVIGQSKIPKTGGAIIASNHQSWFDVQVLGSGLDRRVYFIAKSMFNDWPIMRHIITLTDSLQIKRGGDEKGLEEIAKFIKKGNLVVIFPEGTIPGEEDKPRSLVEASTGLLQGRTGMVRLAIKAKVPIIPVGISGTSRAFPPEIYPRLELLSLPRQVPITIKIGDPIYFEEYYDKEFTKEDLRRLTDNVMKKISNLVDHHNQYVPIAVFDEEENKKEEKIEENKKIGVLLLHGFTSHVKTVSSLIPYLEKRGIPYNMPVLAGHGTNYKDMEGVTAKDWYQDAEKALLNLLEKVDYAIVVGLSMGGLLALDLGINYPEKIVGVVTVAAALRFADPLAFLSPFMSKFIKFWPSPNSYNDKECAKGNENYKKFATKAFVSLYHYADDIEWRLPDFNCPIRIIHSKKDYVIKPKSAQIIYDRISSKEKEIIWFERSGHEMMLDLEKDYVLKIIDEYIAKIVHKFQK